MSQKHPHISLQYINKSFESIPLLLQLNKSSNNQNDTISNSSSNDNSNNNTHALFQICTVMFRWSKYSKGTLRSTEH